ncbi:hypothetical protein CR194_16990 [Salipaludibacillus keqinensis]|uniref:Uncharacterized protein n=1 Tax=Salipaludibacillus keqinensis TaxID=2045207 RepID=A0A323TRC8_9BACI|nr:hypothetical protein [Salipaludibacillus keqinensis]PYZ91905.1 hypothetical protein CR194_16990 [Salipaludibacillus keqinensis]
MIGFMLNGKEAEEIEYLLKRELEELLLDLTDDRLDGLIHKAMEERYKIIYQIYKRFASPRDLCKYLRRPPSKSIDSNE